MGEWRTLRLDWSRPNRASCRCCGRPLYGRVWADERGEFCDPECAELYVDYWLPRYGAPGQDG
jgi:hypothetical protein